MCASRRNSPPGNRTSFSDATDLNRHTQKEQLTDQRPKTPDSMVKTKQLLHELQLHKAELDEELLQARAKIEVGISHFTNIYDSIPFGCITLERDGTIRQLNLAAANILGKDRAELTGKRLDDFVASESLSLFNALLNKVFDKQCNDACEITFVQTDNPPLIAHIEAITDNATQQCHLMVINITEHKTSSDRIQRLARFESAISEIRYKALINQSLKQIFRAACNNCVDLGGFSLAWIGLADPEMQRIMPIEVAGPAARYLHAIDSRFGLETQAEREPSPNAYIEQRAIICSNISTNPALDSWRDRAVANGLYSSIALPLFSGGKPYGTLTAYASEINFIDTELANLLEKMADSLTQAIDKLNHEEEHRRDIEKLLQSEEKFRSLVENLPLKIFLKDGNSRYISCNDLFAKSLGVSPDQITGKSDYDFFPLELANKHRDNDQQIIISGKGIDLHERQVQGDVEKFSHVIKTPFKNVDGQIVGVLGASWDITERKQAERIKDHFAYEVEDLYQNAPCGYHSIDADGTITRINNTELNWLGYKREEVVDRLKACDILTSTSCHELLERLPVLIKVGELKDLEIDMLRKDGTVFPVNLSATAVYDEEGCYVSSRTMVYDISKRKDLEHEQRLRGKRIEELSRCLITVQEEERRRLAGELHDRANPNLAAIQLMLENFTTSMPEELRTLYSEYLDDIHALLEDTMANIREICTELRPPLLDYSGLVPTLEGYAQQFMQRTGIAVRVSTWMNGPRLNKEVESLLFRIAQEAISNCAKHASAKNIRIELANDNRHSVLTIKDDGIGFNPEIFRHTGHTPGLGLITMKERAEIFGGKFSLTSNLGAGTEIKVEFWNKDRRSERSRRQPDLVALSRVPAQPNEPAQPRDNFIERRACMSRRKQDLAPNTRVTAQPNDPTQPHFNFIERRSSVSRRQQDFSASTRGSAHPAETMQSRENFIERRTIAERRSCMSRRQQDLVGNYDAPAQSVTQPSHPS